VITHNGSASITTSWLVHAAPDGPQGMDLLIDIKVTKLEMAIAFYGDAFGLVLSPTPRSADRGNDRRAGAPLFAGEARRLTRRGGGPPSL
jgi:hypothetical protein